MAGMSRSPVDIARAAKENHVTAVTPVRLPITYATGASSNGIKVAASKKKDSAISD
jgi:hypothetical protein